MLYLTLSQVGILYIMPGCFDLLEKFCKENRFFSLLTSDTQVVLEQGTFKDVVKSFV